MKFLFAAMLIALPLLAEEAKPKPAALAHPVPPAQRVAKPGFWERAWKSTQKGAGSIAGATKRAGKVIASPFSREKKSEGSQASWQSLALAMEIAPEQIKLSEAKTVKVSVVVRNVGKHATQLDFTSTQRIEALLKTEEGKVISRSSDDQKIDKEQDFLVINPGERLEYHGTVSTRGMTAGQSYVIEAYFPAFDSLRAVRVVSPVK